MKYKRRQNHPQKLTVHHKDGIKSNSEGWNLETLCSRHHLIKEKALAGMPGLKRGEYPANWKEISLRIKQRDGFKCLQCTAEKEAKWNEELRKAIKRDLQSTPIKR